MKNNKRNIAVASVVGLSTLLCAGISSESKKDNRHESSSNVPIREKQNDFADGLREILEDIEDTGVQGDDFGEFTVDIPVDENGNIPFDFDYIAAIRDCVESSGELKCISGMSGTQYCYGLDINESNYPVNIISGYSLTLGSQRVEAPVFVRGYKEDFMDVETYKYASDNPNSSKIALDTACNDAIRTYQESGKIDLEGESLENLEMNYDLFAISDDFFSLANEFGLQIVDEGGLEQKMILDGVEVEVKYAIDADHNVPADETYYFPSIEVKMGEWDYYHNFATADEALEYLLEKD